MAGQLSGAGVPPAAAARPAGEPGQPRPAGGPVAYGQLALAGDVATAVRDGLVVQLAGGLPLAGAADAIGTAAGLAAAWRRHGERALARIPGEWLAVVWDEPARTLVCARSARGFRRLFWRADKDGLRFGTALADLVGPARRLNEAFLVELLANRVTTFDETPFAGVHRLPAGHLLRARPGEPPRVRRWFDPAPSAPLALDRAEAARELRRRLETVVAEHVPTTTGVLVSGGLDSNTVLAVARHVTGERGRVVGCSMIFPGQPHDESAWLDAVDRDHPEPVWRLVARDYDWALWRGWSAQSLLPPLRPNIAKSDPAVRLLAAAGIRGVLTGEGGDDWFGGGPLHWPELLRRGRVGPVLGAAGRGFPSPRAGLTAVVRRGLAPLLPRPPRRPVVPPWVGAEAARRTGLVDRLWEVNLARHRVRTDARRLRAARVGHPHVVWQLEGTRDRFAAHGVAWRHPLHDQRIADLAVRLPGEVMWRPDETKTLLRAAARDLLPPEIVRRQGKTTFEAPIVAAIRAVGGADSLAGHPLVTEGYLNLPAVREMERLVLADHDAGVPPRPGRDVPSLWAVYSTATWFSQVWPS